MTDSFQFEAGSGPEETIAMLKDLEAKFESGEIRCAALRVFKPDGTWEDVAVGGDEQDQAEALMNLRSAQHRN